jgi:hypothetical protein
MNHLICIPLAQQLSMLIMVCKEIEIRVNYISLPHIKTAYSDIIRSDNLATLEVMLSYGWLIFVLTCGRREMLLE